MQCRDTKYERSQESVKVQKFSLRAAAGVRVERNEGHDIEKQEVQKP